MTRTYVLDPVSRAVLGLVDQSWQRLAYRRRYFGVDTFEMAINRSRLYASELRVGRLLLLPDEGNRVFLIEQVQALAEGSALDDAMTVAGRSLEGVAMVERLVEPDAGQAYDRQTAVAAESAIKHYVRRHAADLAAAARQVPNLVVAPDIAAGPLVTVAGRYQTVFDIVREIGLASGLGWEIRLEPATNEFVFDIVAGVDRQSSVFFDFAFETLERWEELASILDSKTVAVVAGQGEGADRDIVRRFASGSEPSGFERREAFIDARDIERGDTATLATRGDAFLQAAAAETRLEAGIHQYGSFRYGIHWDLGDLVLIRNAERGVAYPARVVEVERTFERSAAAPVVTAVIDRPFPTFAERVAGSGAAGGAVDSPSAGAAGPAGGDLSGTYPDPQVIDDSHNHSQATVPYPSLGTSPSSQAFGDGAAGGSATSAAKTDHKHAFPTSTAGPDANVTIDAAGAAGTANSAARSQHGHRLNTYASTPARDSTTGGAGTSGAAPARGDHAHPHDPPIRRVYTATGANTWTKPANLAAIEVECVGGGGAGGGAATTSSSGAAGGGGGGGAYARKLLSASALAGASSFTATVGTGGTAGTAGGNAGNAGGASTFAGTGITTVSAGGGSGGGGGASSTGRALVAGGAGGDATGGDVNVPGSDGGTGVVDGGSVTSPAYGGASGLAHGGITRANTASGNGIAGNLYGGGGGAAYNQGTQGTARQGGVGGAGIVIVTEHYL
jgi:hypothetical protein